MRFAALTPWWEGLDSPVSPVSPGLVAPPAQPAPEEGLSWMTSSASPLFLPSPCFQNQQSQRGDRRWSIPEETTETVSCSSWTLILEKARKLLDPPELSVSKIKFHSGTCAWL